MLKREWIYIALIVGLAIFLYNQRSNFDDEILKQNELIVEESKEKFNKSIDSLKVANKELGVIITNLENTPPKLIPRYYEKIIYVYVADSTIIRSITRETKSYREKRKW